MSNRLRNGIPIFIVVVIVALIGYGALKPQESKPVKVEDWTIKGSRGYVSTNISPNDPSKIVSALDELEKTLPGLKIQSYMLITGGVNHEVTAIIVDLKPRETPPVNSDKG